jgi:CRISPR-associated endonuclease/helicase Cas3
MNNESFGIVPLSACQAKTIRCKNGQIVPGINIFGHSVIVGEIAKALIRYYNPALRKKLFPPGSELVAANHDLGKIYPLFIQKIHNSIAGIRENPEAGMRWSGHAAVSQAALDGCPRYIPEIAGRHHGFSCIGAFPANYVHFGGQEWQNLRMELLQNLMSYFDVQWPKVKNRTHAAVLSGLVSVSDWIGSGSAFEDITSLENISDLPARAREAIDRAGFVRPKMKKGLSFEEIFEGKRPRPVQSLFIESASSQGVYVLEAPMGIGKTEAALYAAYNLCSTGKASGIYFALPTQLTSDRIYKRVNLFLEKVLMPEPKSPKALLVHGSAWLTETELGGEGEPGSSWFHAGRRRILAPFGVGTIDQALMAVMNVKYGFVRAFALAGKVVILDEVHTYDSYTGTLLDTLVEWLKEMGCTVIILSATLTGERKRKILNLNKGKTTQKSVELSAYPLISSVAGRKKTATEIPAEGPKDKTVIIHRVSDEQKAVSEVLKRAEEGQQILWIENTVDEAQCFYRLISARAKEYDTKIETGLLHSRFTRHDREVKENKWVDLFGEAGKEKRKEHGRVLVGTQVLEQSLDIDADFLVTRICPTDMLLQRLGRLWRLDNNSRTRPKACEAWILSDSYDEVLEYFKKNPGSHYNDILGKTFCVYDPYVILRSLEIWDQKNSLVIPKEIRCLVEKTYIEREEKYPLNKLKQNLCDERERLTRLAFRGLASNDKTLPDTGMDIRYKTRYSEVDTVEVLLLAKEPERHSRETLLVLPDGKSLELRKGLKHGTPEEKREWRETAQTLHQHIVTVPENKAPLPVNSNWLEQFRDYIYTGSKEYGEDLLRIAIIRNTNELAMIGNVKISDAYSLHYDEVKGYWAEKMKKGGNLN